MLLVRTRVAPSPIHGLGLFAAEPIRQGETIARHSCLFDEVFTDEAAREFGPVVYDFIRTYGYRHGEDWVLPSDHLCFMNHATEANTFDDGGDDIAARDIAAGEEITGDYFAFDLDAARKLGGHPPEAPT